MAIVNGDPVREIAVPSTGWNTIDCDIDGKSAITEWRALRAVKSLHGKDGQLTLVELKPKTGRYHQLRRHMVSSVADATGYPCEVVSYLVL